MNSRFNCNFGLCSALRRSAALTCFLALFVLSSTSVVWADDFVPTPLVPSALDVCVGESVTFTADVPDAGPGNPVTNVPWQIYFNGVLLGNDALDAYLTLDASVGTSLADWSLQTSLTFTPLEQGCYTVDVLDFIALTSTNQEILSASIKVSDIPSQPTLSGFDQLFCLGESIDGGVSSFTVGESTMSLEYTLDGPAGFTLVTGNGSAVGEACDGPSVDLVLLPTELNVAGAYTLTAEAVNVCGTSMNSLDIEAVVYPEFELSTDPICTGSDAVVASNIDLLDYTMSNGVPPQATATWNNGAGTDLLSATYPTPSNGDVFVQNIDLNYTFLGFTQTCSGEASVSQVVYTPEPLEVLFNGESTPPASLCEGEGLIVSIVDESAEGQEETYTWTTTPLPNAISPDGLTYTWDAVDFDVVIEIAQTSIYPDDNGTTCPSLAVNYDIPVVNMPVLAWTTSDVSVCEGETATLFAEVLSVEGASTNLSWTSDFGTEAAVTTGVGSSFGITVAVPLLDVFGSTVVTLTPTDELGCVGESIEGLVEYYIAPDPTGTVPPLCEGDDVTPTGLLTGPGFTYAWSYNGTASALPSPTFTEVTCDSDLSLVLARTYAVDGDLLTCTSDPYAFDLNVTPSPSFDLVLPDVACDGLELAFSVNALEVTEGCEASEVSYAWTIEDGDGLLFTSNDPNVSVPGGNYDALDITVQATQTSASNDCIAVTAQTLVVHENPDIAPPTQGVTLCPNSSSVMGTVVLSDPNGGLNFQWTNADEELFDFLVDPSGLTAGITLMEDVNATEGSVLLTVTDALGCSAEATSMVDILDLPEPQNVTWSVPALCSNDEVTITMTDPLVDPSLDLSLLTYSWTAFGSNGDNYTVTSTPGTYTDVVSNIALNDAAWPVPQPNLIGFELMLDDGTCAASYVYENQVELYPLPELNLAFANPAYNDVCEGADWMGDVLGASSLTYTGPSTGDVYNMSIVAPGAISWEVPWAEIDLDVANTTPFTLTLNAEADYGDAVCQTTWDLTLDVFDAPEVNLNNTNLPASICVGSTANVSSGFVPGSGTGSGQQMNYSWTNADQPGVFDIQLVQNGSTAIISVANLADVPDEGNLQFNIEDINGCIAEETFPITIIELPVIGELTSVVDPTICSGSEITIELSEVTVDDGLDVSDLQFDWSAGIDTQVAPPTVAANGLSVTVTPVIAEVAFQDFVSPEALDLSLTTTIEGCSSTADWVAVAEVYPLPLREADNNNVCVGQAWEATVTGCEVLTVYGQAPNPDLTWTTNDPAAGMDIVLPQSYMQAPTGQTQQTLDFYAGVTYSDVGLTCFNERPFALFRRQAPGFTLSASDDSGPADDLVMCEGGNLTLTSNTTPINGINSAFSWAQVAEDGSGALDPLTSTDEDAFFINVTPSAPFDQPTLVEGKAYVTYTYNVSAAEGFECVVEQDWSYQVMPTPVVDWTSNVTHACDGDNVEVSVSLDAGATSLNGNDVTWEWDWSGSTFNDVIPTTDPTDDVMLEAVYESTLDGSFDQSFDLVVTDSYGCISTPPTEISFVALERAVVDMERPFVCADDTLEVLAQGADVYTWNVDTTTLDGFLEPAAYFPNYVPTGDSLQSLILNNPLNGDIIEVTGGLVYEIAENDFLSCEASASINLVVFDMPVLEMTFLADPAPYCDGDLVTFEDVNTTGTNITYDYWTSAGLDVTGEVSNTVSFQLQSAETTFEVTKYASYPIQGTTTVCSVMEPMGFEVIPNPVISVNGNAGMCQDGVGSIVCDVSDPIGGFTYQPIWTASSNADTSEVVLGPGSFSLQVSTVNGINVAPEPDLVFSVYVKDNNGCLSETEPYNMQVVATPVLAITDSLMDELCSPTQDCMQVALLNEDLSGVGVEYFWDNEPGGTNAGICVNFVNPTNCPFTDSTSVTVRYEHTLANGQTVFCENAIADSTVVNPTPVPGFSLEAPQACLDLNALNCVPILHDTTSYDICENDSISYEWFVTPLGDLIQNNLVTEDLNTAFPSICVDTAGVVSVVLEMTNSHGCAQTTSNVPFTVHGLPVPELTFEQPSICLPTTVSVLNSSSGAANFSMSIPGYPVYEDFLSPLELDVEFPGYYNAEFTVTNTHVIDGHELMCSVDTEYVSAFEGRTPPIAEFAVLPDTLIDFVNPVVEFVNLSEGQVENIWSFGNGEGSSELDPEVEYEVAGLYNAQLQVVNEYGCTDVYSQEIEVYTDLYVYVPTAFTPDNDGLNDAWLPSIIGQDVIATYECSVFTRSGDRVFYTTDPNKAWVGGNDLSGEGMHFSSGGEVFAWRISIKKKDGQGAKTYTGQVTMIR